jgi:hypothetical protein
MKQYVVEGFFPLFGSLYKNLQVFYRFVLSPEIRK